MIATMLGGAAALIAAVVPQWPSRRGLTCSSRSGWRNSGLSSR